MFHIIPKKFGKWYSSFCLEEVYNSAYIKARKTKGIRGQLSSNCFNITLWKFFLHLHEIVEGLYFHCSLSVCVSVCLSVCPAILVNKIQAEQIHRFGRSLRLMAAYITGSDPIQIGDLGSKVKVTVAQNPFFLHNSLLTSLLCILAPLCPMKVKFDIPFRYALGRFAFHFHKKFNGR